MPTFSHAASSDPLGLATAGDIVLIDVSPEKKFDIIDILSEEAVPLKSSSKAIRGVIEVTINYELKSSSLEIALGVDVGSNGFRVFGISLSNSPDGYPQVSVTAIKPVSGSFADTPGNYGSITIPGGFGVVALYGATCSQPISSSMSISSQRAIAIHHTDGTILTQGLVLYAYRMEASIEGYTAITAPAGAKVSAQTDPNKTGREAFNTHSISFTLYIVDN